MDRRDFLKLGGSAVAAGALAAKTAEAVDAQTATAGRLSAVVGLSVQSVARKSAPVDVPDFTRGRWKTRTPLPIFHM